MSQHPGRFSALSSAAYVESSASGTTMEVQSSAVAEYYRMLTDAVKPHRTQTMSALKARQSAKIREIVSTLLAEGFVTLGTQARVLGLGRSSAWSVLHNHYKNTGLTASTIDHILSSPRLPQSVRVLVIEYIEDKLAGRYGHSHQQRRRFAILLTAKMAESGHLEDIAA